jgi:outer membrane receptor protein involved in Fe transport
LTAACLAATLLAGSAALAEEPPASGVLTYTGAYFADAHPNTAMDMIRRLPGFVFDNGESARGFAGTAGNVLINGQRPTSKTDDLQSILNRIPAADVDRIELIRGGAPGIDMQGRSVMANVIRKTAESTRIVVDATDNIFLDGHTIPSLSVEFTQHTGDSTYELALQRFAGFDDSVGLGHRTFTDATGTVVQYDHEDRQATGAGEGLNGAVTTPLWGGEFKGNITLQDSPFHSDLAFTHPGYRADIISHTGSQNLEIGAHWKGLIDGLGVETLLLERLGRSTSLNIYRDPSTDQDFFAKNITSETIFRTTVRDQLTPTLTIEAGGEVAYNYLDGTSAFTLDGLPIALPSANVTVDEKRGEIFGQATWKALSDLTIEVGARFEYSEISESGDSTNKRSFFYPKPRALVTWAPNDKTQVRFRYEKVLGQLDFGNFVATSDLGGNGVHAGNADLRPDQRDQYELAFEQHFWDKGAIVVTLLHEEITDVVDLVPVDDGHGNLFDAPGNIGYGTNNKIDIELTLPLDFLGIENALFKSTSIWNMSRVHDPLTHQIRVISGQRPQDMEFTISKDFTSLNSTLTLSYFNGWRERYYNLQELRDRKIPPGLISINWTYNPTPDWSFVFEVDNLDPFIYDDKHYRYDPSRATGVPVMLEERVVRSQPRLYLEIRKTFD